MFSAIAMAATLAVQAAPAASSEQAPAVLRAVADKNPALLGVRWGESVADVKRSLSPRYPVTYEQDVAPKGTHVVRFGVTFSELADGELDAEFYRGRLTDVCVSFSPEVVWKAVEIWRLLVAAMTTEYGSPTQPPPSFRLYSELYDRRPPSPSAEWVANHQERILNAVRDQEWTPRATWAFDRGAVCTASFSVAIDDGRTQHISSAFTNVCCSGPDRPK